jgi:hypothetical protein
VQEARVHKLEGEVNELALQVQHEKQEGRLLQQELATSRAELAAAQERIAALIETVEGDKNVRLNFLAFGAMHSNILLVAGSGKLCGAGDEILYHPLLYGD